MEYKGIKVIGSIDNLLIILPQNRVDEIAITLGIDEYHKLEYIVNMCEKSGVHTKFIPDYNNIIPTKPYTEDLLGLPVINIRHVPLNGTVNKVLKRTMDIFGAICALILFSPVMLITAAAIKITSPGPLIFEQERVGLQNRPFSMYKFRSMIVQDADKEKNKWTTKDDPRVTKCGGENKWELRKVDAQFFCQFCCHDLQTSDCKARSKIQYRRDAQALTDCSQLRSGILSRLRCHQPAVFDST